MKLQQVQESSDAVLHRVCSACIDAILSDHDEFVRCGLPDDRPCPLKTHLPQLVEAIRSVDSPWMDDYVTAVRAQVCATCESHEVLGEKCVLRDKADCALDRYILPVLRAIEAEATTEG
jgi:hypothetical protein